MTDRPMRFPRIIAGLLVAVLLAGKALAQEESSPVRADLVYASRHVFRGVERAGDSLQAAIEFNREGFHGGLWSNQPFERDDAREVSVDAAYGWQATDGLAVETSLTHSWFSRVPGGGVDRSLEAGLTATLTPTGGFTPSLAYYHDFQFHADTVEVAFARSVPLTKLGAFLELNFFGGWARGSNWRPNSPGPNRRDSYGYWGGEVRLPYRVGPHSTVVAGLHYADSFGRSLINGPFARSARGNFWATLGVSLDF